MNAERDVELPGKQQLHAHASCAAPAADELDAEVRSPRDPSTPPDRSFATRYAFPRLHWFWQRWLDDLTLKPGPGRRAPGRTALGHVAYSLLCVVAGVALSAAAWRAGSALLALGWVLLVFGARRLQLLAVHQAAHRALWRPEFDHWFGRIASVVFFLEEFISYQRHHVSDHHSKRLSTEHDPTVIFLRAAGFQPGKSVRWSYCHLAWTLVSPRFHCRVFRGRIASHVTSPRRGSRLAMVLYLAALAVIAQQLGWGLVAVAWLLPLTIAYQASALLRLLVEHVGWPVASGKLAPPYVERTHDIGIGVAPPRTGLRGMRRLRAWAVWSLRMLCAVAVRTLILPGDTPLHGAHHMFGDLPGFRWQDYAWAAAAFAQARREAGLPPIPFFPSYGAALRATFEHLAALPPQAAALPERA